MSNGMMKLLSIMRFILVVGSFWSLKYLDLISVRQIEGVYNGSSPSTQSFTLKPLFEPMKYSTHAKESRSFMRFFLVSKVLCCEPRIGSKHAFDRFEELFHECLIYCF